MGIKKGINSFFKDSNQNIIAQADDIEAQLLSIEHKA